MIINWITGNSVVGVGVSNNRTFNSISKRDKSPPTDKASDIQNTTFSSASTDTSYVPCFDSPTSENSIKTKKLYYIDYLIGLGNWIVKGIDISIICAEYRAFINEKCKARTILNSDEELTTNPRKSIELIFAEVKPPNARSNLVNEDLVALGKIMRASLDKLLNNGVDIVIVICGLHVIDK
ncbi:27258_t:CDS:2 [Gigaspora margarita]|uniref:27258_t:CDS:1 n=1 Tax=Gigaspora margarita TaxID=4874 RepID=A0ABN7WPY0_GIGMA|nr:27258_t:CDS:2 [Gigaspora margarita]